MSASLRWGFSRSHTDHRAGAVFACHTCKVYRHVETRARRSRVESQAWRIERMISGGAEPAKNRVSCIGSCIVGCIVGGMSKRARGRGGEQDAVAGCAVTRGKERAGKPLEQRKGDPQATAGWRMALKEKGWLCGMGQALPWSLAAQIWQARLESRKGRAMRHKQKQYWYLPTHLQHHHNRRHPYDTPRTTVYPLWGVTQQKAVARPTLAT